MHLTFLDAQPYASRVVVDGVLWYAPSEPDTGGMLVGVCGVEGMREAR